MKREHGGPDAWGVPRWDFSTNANACGPCPEVNALLSQVDASHYPDPSYQSLCEAIASFHGVDKARVVLAASASEFIMRITAVMARLGRSRVWLPEFSYGEYAQAAQVWNFTRVTHPQQAQLSWLCEPSSPLGQAEVHAQEVTLHDSVVVLDRAYEPLRLSGRSSLDDAALAKTWQLWSPNKALGLTGIRGAYAIAPQTDADMASMMRAQAPSWPLGTHAVTMLMAWTTPEVQTWVAHSRETLREWKRTQLDLLSAWCCLPSDANFFCIQASLDAERLRAQGIKLRDATSFGLPGHWRLSVQPPHAQQVLWTELMNAKGGL